MILILSQNEPEEKERNGAPDTCFINLKKKYFLLMTSSWLKSTNKELSEEKASKI